MSDLAADPAPQSEPTGGGGEPAGGGERQAPPSGGERQAPPSGEDDLYPTEFDSGARADYVHETVINGHRVGLTKEDIDQAVYSAIQLERSRGMNQGDEPQTKPAEKPAESAPDEKFSQMEQRLNEITQKLNAREHADLVKTTAETIKANLDAEIKAHKVFKDYPKLAEIGRQQAMALMSANTKMSEKDAVQTVAAAQGAVINEATEKYVKGKISDAANSEAQPGGGKVATPGPKPMTGQDLMRGRVRDKAMRRLMDANVS